MNAARRLSLIVLAIAAPAFAPAASAADPAKVQITAHRVELPDAATMRAMTGRFALSDGRTMRVLHPGLNLMVAFDRGRARTVEPIGDRQFASADGRLIVAYDADLESLRVIEQRQVTVASRGTDTPLR